MVCGQGGLSDLAELMIGKAFEAAGIPNLQRRHGKVEGAKVYRLAMGKPQPRTDRWF